jgi:hypothetical protein
MKKADPKYHQETKYGFKWADTEVARLFSLPDGSIAIMVKASRGEVQVHVTATGLIRVYDKERGRLAPLGEKKK